MRDAPAPALVVPETVDVEQLKRDDVGKQKLDRMWLLLKWQALKIPPGMATPALHGYLKFGHPIVAGNRGNVLGYSAAQRVAWLLELYQAQDAHDEAVHSTISNVLGWLTGQQVEADIDAELTDIQLCGEAHSVAATVYHYAKRYMRTMALQPEDLLDYDVGGRVIPADFEHEGQAVRGIDYIEPEEEWLILRNGYYLLVTYAARDLTFLLALALFLSGTNLPQLYPVDRAGPAYNRPLAYVICNMYAGARTERTRQNYTCLVCGLRPADGACTQCYLPNCDGCLDAHVAETGHDVVRGEENA